MREVNRSLVLDVLRDGGEMSRVEVARRTRLSKPTVSAIVDALLGDGLVLEVGTGPSQARGGRPPTLLAFNDTQVAYGGVHLGAHHSRVVLADGRGRTLLESGFETPQGDVDATLQAVGEAVLHTARRAGAGSTRLGACGVAVAGIVDTQAGRCRDSAALGWRDVDVRTPLESTLGMPVVLTSTLNAAAFAEGRLGRAAGLRTFAHVHAGTGVDAAILVDGVPLQGAAQMAGGIGHCTVDDRGPHCECGAQGCLQTVASAAAVSARVAHELVRGEESLLRRYRGALDGAVVAQAAYEGDALAVRVMQDAGRMLGRAVAYIVNLIDPDCVVIAGPLVHARDVLLDAVRDEAARHARRHHVTVECSSLGQRAPLLGTVQLAMAHGTPSYRIVGRSAGRR